VELDGCFRSVAASLAGAQRAASARISSRRVGDRAGNSRGLKNRPAFLEKARYAGLFSRKTLATTQWVFDDTVELVTQRWIAAPT
jgi:hypothetical protein